MGIKPDSAPTLLKRTLGLRTVVSTSAGLTFASSTFLMVVLIGTTLTGNASWIPITIAGLLCALAAAAFSELNGMYPSAAGIRLWLQRAFGEKAALVTALSYMSVVALVVGTEAYVLSAVLHEAVPAIAPPVWIFLMLTLATAANLRGLKVAGALQDIITYSVIASITVISVIALNHAHWHIPTFTHPGPIGKVASMVGVAIFLFVGFEWVTPLAEEVREPKSIPYGMFIALGLLVAGYSLISTAMFSAPGLNLLGSPNERQPIPHIIFAGAVLGPIGRIAMIVTSLCMSLTTFNAGLISVSRFIYASAREHVLPKQLERVSIKFSTPIAAIVTVYVLALAVSMFVYCTRQYVILLNVAAATEALIYAFAAACVFMLRRKEAATQRPYRMWGGLWLPAATAVLFFAVGIGVFFTETTFEYWGAGILLAVVAAAWALYVHFVVAPRKERIKAEQAAKRQSRRPARPAQAATPPSSPHPESAPAHPVLPPAGAAEETA
jgi:amino acid transporter